MPKQVNFVVLTDQENFFSVYKNVLKSFIDPILKYLPEGSISEKSIPDAINIHFFQEPVIRQRVQAEVGTSIFMSHGIADKHYRDGYLVKMFDFICVSGPLWVDKMLKEGIAADKILKVGYTKLDPIFQGVITRTPHDKKRVLWAPTHANHVSSYPGFLPYLEKFPSELEVIASPHPFHKQNRLPTMQELVDADVVISDTGSLVYEAWAVGKPVIFLDWLIKDAVAGTFEDRIYKQKIGLHADNFDHLIRLVYRAIDEGVDARAIEFIDAIFAPGLRGTSGAVTATKLRELAEVH